MNWINTEEKLPKLNKMVLAINSKGVVGLVERVEYKTFCNDIDWRWHPDNPDYFDADYKKDITHYCSIPKLPEYVNESK